MQVGISTPLLGPNSSSFLRKAHIGGDGSGGDGGFHNILTEQSDNIITEDSNNLILE